MIDPQGQNIVRSRARMAFFVSLICMALYLVFSLPRISVPLTFSYLIYLVVNPLVPAIVKLGISRQWSIVLLFSGLTFLSVYPIVKIVPVITQEAENLNYYIPKMEKYVKSQYRIINSELKKRTGFEVEEKYLLQGISFVKKNTASFLLGVPKFLASALEWTFLIPLFLFFLLRDTPQFKRLLLKLVPNSIFERFYYLTHQFNKQLGDYIFAKFVEASIVGIIISAGLMIMDVKFALILGIIAGITNVIPYVGPIIGAIPGIIFALVEYNISAKTGGVSILYIVANSIDMILVFPILVSKIVNLHPILVVGSVILGSQYLGIVGMIISIPAAAAVKLIFLEIYNEIYPSRWK